MKILMFIKSICHTVHDRIPKPGTTPTFFSLVRFGPRIVACDRSLHSPAARAIAAGECRECHAVYAVWLARVWPLAPGGATTSTHTGCGIRRSNSLKASRNPCLVILRPSRVVGTTTNPLNSQQNRATHTETGPGSTRQHDDDTTCPACAHPAAGMRHAPRPKPPTREPRDPTRATT